VVLNLCALSLSDLVRAERSAYGDSLLHMAEAAVAGSIILMAHQGIRMGEQRGVVNEGWSMIPIAFDNS
jgi:hypothetical protein